MHTHKLARRLMSGSTLRIISLLASIIVAFFLTPYLIISLGDRLYGFWTLVGAFMGFYGFLDFGLSSAISRYVSRACSQKDDLEVNVVINTSLVLFSFIGFVALLITAVVMLISPLIIAEPDDITLFRILLLIFGIDVSIGFPMRALMGGLVAKLRYDILVYINLAKLVVRTSLVFYFVDLGYGLVALAVITLGVNFLGYIIGLYSFKRNYPDVVFGRDYVAKNKVKQLFDYSKYTFIGHMSDFLRFRIDSFVIAGFLGLEMVTIYAIAQKLIDYFGSFVMGSMGLLTPVFSEYEGRGEFDKIRKLFLISTKICTTVTVFVGGCIMFYGKYFITLWVGAEYDEAYVILIILCLASMFDLMQNPTIGLLYGISKHKYYAISNSCEGVLNLAASLVLVRYYGIYGVAMGTLIGTFLFKLFVQPVYTCRFIEQPVSTYYFEMLFSISKLVPLMLIYFYCATFYIEKTYFSLFSIAVIQVALFIPYCYLFVLGNRERKVFRLGLASSS
ncbi:MAG TPA: hypothetical protein DCG57_18635 [Candidatus Riflebacteria bacterium]|nr:hypothetical protein [Candidatus Riflebacteria bacterium]